MLIGAGSGRDYYEKWARALYTFIGVRFVSNNILRDSTQSTLNQLEHFYMFSAIVVNHGSPRSVCFLLLNEKKTSLIIEIVHGMGNIFQLVFNCFQ